jgi:hypothetical protein
MNPYISEEEKAKLSRTVYELPDFIELALKENNLEEIYRNRLAYQKNDYIGWIMRAKAPETQQPNDCRAQSWRLVQENGL